MELVIIFGPYILATMCITLQLMHIPKNPLNKRIVLYLSTVTAITIPILMRGDILFLIAFYLYVSSVILITRLLMRILEEARDKRIALYLSISAILIPIWDVSLIYWEFNQLCKTEAGIHVYEKAVLGPKYWKDDGTLNFLPTFNLEKALPGEFELVSIVEKEFDSLSGSSRSRWQIKRKKDQKVIGETIYFRRGRIWFNSGGSGEGCPDPRKVPRSSLVEAVFKQQFNH